MVFDNLSPFRKNVIFFGILTIFFFAGSFIFQSLSLILIQVFLPEKSAEDILTLFSELPENELSDRRVVSALKLFHLFGTIGGFIIPALLFIRFVLFRNIGEYTLNKSFSLLAGVLVAGIFLCSIPVSEWFYNISHDIPLPKMLKENLLAQEQFYQHLYKVLLLNTDFSDFLFTLLLTGVMAAFGEELFFRGVIQRLLMDWIKKPMLSITITALIFSALHFQFYSFLPRVLLGILLGYVFYRTGSLWISIMAHFIFNSITILLAYLNGIGVIQFNIAEWKVPFIVIIFAALLMIILLLVFNRITGKEILPVKKNSQ